MSAQPAVPQTRDTEGPYDKTAKSAAVDEYLLVAEARAGCSGAFELLYERHRTRVYRIAYRILRNEQDAEDASQRSFQRAFAKLAGFRGESSFSTWLTRIAINEALMLLRQRRTSAWIVETESHVDYESPAVNPVEKALTPEDVLAAKEVGAAVTEAISNLRQSLRTVVLLREFQGLTSIETARRIGLTVAAVKSRSLRAKRDLRRHLERKFQPVRRPLLMEK
ncbi:MAG TPA: sigma-70 family RNA polymerase sigma factor [Candidatus Sulfotelmatobacter sp.]|nr:sigma-70 family RNA polymerase sigma factor [Candidatus Sulfotelmatobacter sp.]